MSGAVLDGSGDGGVITDTANAAALVSVQASDPTIVSHVGTPTANFDFVYNGATISFLFNIPFIADAGLYAGINASSTAAALVTWSD